MDGYGIGKKDFSNAIYKADTPNLDYLFNTYPYVNIEASGIYVGLPANQMGNSEVGHLTIGSGRIDEQSLSLINNKIKDGSFFQNKTLITAIKYAINNNKIIHLLGLASYGGVHSHMNHLKSLIKMCADHNATCCIDLITDGRDTFKNVSLNDINELEQYIRTFNKDNIFIGSIVGRFYAMDRDKRWERIQISLNALYHDEKAQKFNNVIDYIKTSYQNEIYDEFIVPAYNQTVDSQIHSGDVVIMFNFRQDRAIQISSCLTNSNYEYHPKKIYKDLYFVSMRFFASSVKSSHIVYPFAQIKNTFGEYVANLNYSQLRIAETEKYAHVTYFFDGGVNIEYQNEARILLPSPKVRTYDLKPEMSAFLITDHLVKNIGKYDFIILNFANCDMVGHTGNFQATIKSINDIDQCIGKIYEICKIKNSTLIITSDHGNAELMVNNEKQIIKSHTNNKIPFCVVNSNYVIDLPKNYVPSLQDVAPSILYLAKIKKPREMTGISIIKEKNND